MRDLRTALEDHDLVTLRVIGDWWELDLTGADKAACVKALADRLGQIDIALELNYLPAEEAGALLAVAQAGGQMPVGAFTRQFGDVRQMGPGRLEREEPWLAPENPAEALWYRGLLYKGFDQGDDTGSLLEYFYVPDEFRTEVPADADKVATVVSKTDAVIPAAEPPRTTQSSGVTAVEDLTTLLTFAQNGRLTSGKLGQLEPYLFNPEADRVALLLTLADEMDILRTLEGTLRPARSAVKWLKDSRDAQLSSLSEVWSASRWNELCHTPGLRCEGSGWDNDPVLARNALLENLPRDEDWHAIDDLVNFIKDADPDFQRPEGNYDSWYIRNLERDEYLKGFESWDLVEGRLLRFLLTGPMVWLGLVEVGDGRFRLTGPGLSWLSGAKSMEPEVRVPIVVQADGTVLVPFNASRYERFQVARVAEPGPLQNRELSEPYQYFITPASLSRAREEGIRPERVLSFLQEASGRPLPASLKRAIERWVQNGLEGRLQTAVIIRVKDASILDTLQSNARTRPLIGERLGDLAAVVLTENWREFQQVTTQLGLLLDHEA